jgi:hypothetical protein
MLYTKRFGTISGALSRYQPGIRLEREGGREREGERERERKTMKIPPVRIAGSNWLATEYKSTVL